MRDLFPILNGVDYAEKQARSLERLKARQNPNKASSQVTPASPREASVSSGDQSVVKAAAAQSTREVETKAITQTDKPVPSAVQTEVKAKELECKPTTAPTVITVTKSSASKIEANRRNAERSTGPRTPRGKRISRQNAVKHGLFADQVVVREGDGKEEGEQFDALLGKLKKELNPVGCLEELEVEIIAQCIWRRRRAARHEAGVILSGTGNLGFEARLTQSDTLMSHCMAPQVFRADLRQSSLGIHLLIDILDSAEQEICSRELTQQRCDLLIAYFEPTPQLTKYREDLQTEQNSAAFKEGILQWIATNRSQLARALSVIEAKEDLMIEAKLARGSLPAEAKKIVRYEGAVDRQMTDALERLRKLQRERNQSEAIARQ